MDPSGLQGGSASLEGRRSSWRTAATRLLASGASLVLSLLVAEAVLRAVAPAPSFRGHSRFHPTLGFVGTPDHSRERRDSGGVFDLTHNRLGFRGPELPRRLGPPAPDTLRMLFIGDSFLKAAMVREEERIAEVVAATLNESGRRTEQFGLSMEGYGTGQELLLWRLFGRQLLPDLVVLVFFTGNDPYNDTLSLAGRSRGDSDYDRPYLVLDGRGGTELRHLNPVRSFFRRHLRSFAYLELYLIERHQAGLPFGIDVQAGVSAKADERVGEEVMPGPFLELIRRNQPDPRYEEAWQTSEALLIRFRDEVEAAGARLLVVVVPFRSQVQRDVQFVLDDGKLGGRLEELVDWNLPEERLHALFRREGMSAVLPLEAMREALRRGERDLYGQDSHLLPAGCRLIALQIAAWVEADSPRGTIEPDPFDPTGPVDLLAGFGSQSSLVDFREDGHLELVRPVGAVWHRGQSGEGAGWRVRDRFRMVVPDGPGELVVRGLVSEEDACPVEVTASVGEQGPTVRALVDTVGPFELRLPGLGTAARPGYWRLELSRRAPGSESIPPGHLVVQEAGFQSD